MKSTIWIGGLAGTLLLAGAQTNCSGQVTLFTCTLSSGETTCSPTAAVNEFITLDLLGAAQGCDSTITEDTPLLVAAAGGSGGNGGSTAFSGGSFGWGGAAIMGTTIADLNNAYGGSDASYCYGIGKQASHSGDGGGAGGASSILRTCDDESQTATTGVLLIAGGGGGGAAGPLRMVMMAAVAGLPFRPRPGPARFPGPPALTLMAGGPRQRGGRLRRRLRCGM